MIAPLCFIPSFDASLAQNWLTKYWTKIQSPKNYLPCQEEAITTNTEAQAAGAAIKAISPWKAMARMPNPTTAASKQVASHRRASLKSRIKVPTGIPAPTSKKSWMLLAASCKYIQPKARGYTCSFILEACSLLLAAKSLQLFTHRYFHSPIPSGIFLAQIRAHAICCHLRYPLPPPFPSTATRRCAVARRRYYHEGPPF